MTTYQYSEFEVGKLYISPSRTISESDIMLFAGLTGDLNELHTSETFAAQTNFGKRIAHGMLTLAMANGLYTRCASFDSVFLGIENWKASKPVFIGDTIKLHLTIADKRRTKAGNRAILDMKYEVVNQDEVVVAEGLFRRMVNVFPKEV